MAYAGTTAATSVSNPPMLIARALGRGGNTTLGSSAGGSAGAGGGLWLYYSSHSSTDMTAALWFTDAYYLGMKQGDVVMCVGASGSSGILTIGVISSVSSAGANLSTSNFVTSTFT